MGQTQPDNYDWLNSITSVAMQRYRARDVNGLLDVLERLDSLQAETTEDPQLGTLETSTVQIILMLAHLYLDRVDFSNCIQLCGCAKEILQQKAQRYINRGKKPRPDSIAWSDLVSMLGDAKWKGPDAICHSVFSIDEMIARYKHAEKKVRQNLDRYSRSGAEKANVLYNLSCCGKQVICTTMRHRKTEKEALIKQFTDWHGPILFDEQHPFYWDLRICELFVARETDDLAYSYCYERAKEAINLTHGQDFDLAAYIESAFCEKTYLLRACRSSLIEFNRAR